MFSWQRRQTELGNAHNGHTKEVTVLHKLEKQTEAYDIGKKKLNGIFKHRQPFLKGIKLWSYVKQILPV